jgi:hypothetical protein
MLHATVSTREQTLAGTKPLRTRAGFMTVASSAIRRATDDGQGVLKLNTREFYIGATMFLMSCIQAKAT